jgi:hypothetical protein
MQGGERREEGGKEREGKGRDTRWWEDERREEIGGRKEGRRERAKVGIHVGDGKRGKGKQGIEGGELNLDQGSDGSHIYFQPNNSEHNSEHTGDVLGSSCGSIIAYFLLASALFYSSPLLSFRPCPLFSFPSPAQACLAPCGSF